jgi:hypothetical protein
MDDNDDDGGAGRVGRVCNTPLRLRIVHPPHGDCRRGGVPTRQLVDSLYP